MKGAIGNAFILNMVITFIIIFFSLLIGSMAYSKAYKVKNYLINEIDVFEKAGKMPKNSSKTAEWDKEVNVFLNKIGYGLSVNNENTCTPKKKNGDPIPKITNGAGRYDYCIYIKYEEYGNNNNIIDDRYHYIVETYMKLDLPVIGKLLRLPVRGETKTYTILQ